jgi:hypothetical protein
MSSVTKSEIIARTRMHAPLSKTQKYVQSPNSLTPLITHVLYITAKRPNLTPLLYRVVIHASKCKLQSQIKRHRDIMKDKDYKK